MREIHTSDLFSQSLSRDTFDIGPTNPFQANALESYVPELEGPFIQRIGLLF